MEENERIEIITSSITLRGLVLDEMSVLEKWIESIISKYFGGNEKWEELMCVIIATDKLTFESKRNILKYIIEKLDVNFIKSHPKWFNDLEFLMQKRNILAHHVVYDRYNAYEYFKAGQIGFIKYKNDAIINYFDTVMVDKIIEDIRKYSTAFRIVYESQK